MAQYTSISALKLLMVVLGLGFFVYILGPPLYWHFVGDESGGIGGSCPPCITECPNDVETKAALADLRNVTLPACPDIDADTTDELQKSKYQKLQEEMKMQKIVADEAQQKSDAAFLEAKKTSSQFQKDAEKCNAGMETSEGAREEAEKLLAQERKTAAMWEARAKALGWKEGEAEEKPAAREAEEVKPVPTIPTSKNGPKVTEELHQNLAVGRYVVQRAVDNEMGALKAARQHAVDLSLL